MRDLRIAFRFPSDVAVPIIFFVLVVSLFPLAISPDPHDLQLVGPGLIWVTALLSILLTLQNFFRSDVNDGSVDQMLLSHHPMPVLMLGRLLALCVTTALPMILVAPILGVFLHLNGETIKVLILTLLLGVPYLNIVGGIGIALTAGLSQSSALVGLLVLPLFVPSLIFATQAVIAANHQLPYTGQLIWMSAMLVFAVTLGPLAISASLKAARSAG